MLECEYNRKQIERFLEALIDINVKFQEGNPIKHGQGKYPMTQCSGLCRYLTVTNPNLKSIFKVFNRYLHENFNQFVYADELSQHWDTVYIMTAHRKFLLNLMIQFTYKQLSKDWDKFIFFVDGRTTCIRWELTKEESSA